MAYNRIENVKSVADAICEDQGYAEYRAFDAEDVEYLAMETQCNYEDVCEILGIALPESLKA
jgi:hypothetical protein